jgi:glycosyltransferase involved in cell wall biosynthesis
VKTWHLLAPEFPPECGGVGDYTALVAAALTRAGDRVYVWHPGTLPDRFGRGARHKIEAGLTADPGSMLVQYVPAAFGQLGMNVPFCTWLWRLRRRGVDVRVMFHEPFFYFGADRPWRNGLALVQRAMAAILLRASTRVYYSTETWTRLLAGYGPPRQVEMLPIPSTIPPDVDAAAPIRDEADVARAPIVGHFGTYGEHVAGELLPALTEIARRLPDARVLLAGRGAAGFAGTLAPGLRSRLDVVDDTDGTAIAMALRTCDLLVQPYPDGVTTRRTSVMAALTTGVPVITTRGPLTEAVWTDSRAVALVPPGDAVALAVEAATLAADPAARRELGARGRRLYDERFALPVTIERLRRP